MSIEMISGCKLNGVFTYGGYIQCKKRAAAIFGEGIAIVAQQFIYWTVDPDCSLKGEFYDDRKWVYFSHDELQKEFYWVPIATLRRRIEKLEKCGLLIIRKSRNPADMRNRYTINQGVLMSLESGKVNALTADYRLVFRAPVDSDIDFPAAAEGSTRGDQNDRDDLCAESNSLHKPRPQILEENTRQGKLKAGNQGDRKVQGSQKALFESAHPINQGLPVLSLEANPEAEPTGSGRETPHVPRPPLAKKAPVRTKDTPRTRNPLLDALALCGGGSLEHMTPTEWGRAAKALKDIRSVKPDLTVEDIQIASDNYTKLYGSSYLTSTALSNNWSKVRPGVVVAQRTQSTAAKPPTRWGIEKEIEQITLTLSNHPGWIDSTKCDLTTRTQQQKDDADALIEKRKALRAQLLSFPSDP